MSRTGCVLANAFDPEPWDARFPESCEEACSIADQLAAPVVLLDRDWPGTEWKMAVERLGSLPHHACVILLSGVSDAYLWQELTRRGGYDVFSKPLQADKAARVVRLALSYWNSAPKPAAPAKLVQEASQYSLNSRWAAGFVSRASRRARTSLTKGMATLGVDGRYY